MDINDINKNEPKPIICVYNGIGNTDTIKAALETVKLGKNDIVIINKNDLNDKDKLKSLINENALLVYNDSLLSQPNQLKTLLNNMDNLYYSDLTKKEQEANIVPVRTEVKINRNDQCPCGSGKKYKKCFLNK